VVTRPRRTLVKVCGLTRLEDARVALEAGADWLGFIVAGESPRRIAPEAAGEMIAGLRATGTVAVMVSPHPDQALRDAQRAGVKRVQLHRVNPASWPADFPLPVIFVLSVGANGALAYPPPNGESLLMLDTADAKLAGGTGRTFDWSVARALATSRRVLLAGGLDDANVADAIREVRPFGVDASSRLERSPGIKDADKVRRFVAAARKADDHGA
jgi:phosphoribosylanthranilate isomerase